MTRGAAAEVSAPRARRLLIDGVDHGTASDDDLRALMARPGHGCIWLDLPAGDPGNPALLREVFGIHPLAVEDADDFGQRPKVEDYDGYLYLVMFAAAGPGDADGLAEVHLLYSERFLITIHRDQTPVLDEVRRRLQAHGEPVQRGPRLLHRVLDSLVDSFFPLLDDVDRSITALEETLDGDDADGAMHQRIFDLRRRLVTVRRAVAPARDQLGRLVSGSIPMPGGSDEGPRYMRDVEDHLIRITDTIDGYRDLLAGLTDVYLSTISNRLNLVMKQLAIVTVIFLPLTFLTGFFGQNFSWLVEHVAGPGHFWLLGILLPVVCVALLVAWFRRRRWL